MSRRSDVAISRRAFLGGSAAAVATAVVAPAIALAPPLPVAEPWLACEGQEVSRQVYAKLFAVIGEQFGAGDGVETFRLPDLSNGPVQGVTDGGHSHCLPLMLETAIVTGEGNDAPFGAQAGIVFQKLSPAFCHRLGS